MLEILLTIILSIFFVIIIFFIIILTFGIAAVLSPFWILALIIGFIWNLFEE